MTANEIKTAKRIIGDRADRFDDIGSDTEGGQSLTVYWVDGGQKMFHTLAQVDEWAEDHGIDIDHGN